MSKTVPHAPRTLADIVPDAVYDLASLAPVVGVSYATLWRLTRRGELASHRVGGGIRVRGADFLAWWDANRYAPAAGARRGESPSPAAGQPAPFRYVRVRHPR